MTEANHGAIVVGEIGLVSGQVPGVQPNGAFGSHPEIFLQAFCHIGQVTSPIEDGDVLLASIQFFTQDLERLFVCLLYTSPSPRDLSTSRMPSSA